MPLTFVLLGLATFAVWGTAASAGRRLPWVWPALLAAAVALALREGFMDARGVPAVAVLGAAAALHRQASGRRARAVFLVVALLAAAALATHRLPGFAPLVVADAMRLSAASAPTSFRAHVDKALAGVILLACFCRLARTPGDWRRALGAGLLAGVGTAAVVVGIAMAAGAVRPDFKFSPIAPAWLAANLLLTCVFEEALFRGIVQRRLAQWMAHRPRWRCVPLLATSLLFGLAHAGGGPVLVAVAAVAGVGYGWAYAATGRVEAAIVAHFVVNAIHFVGFTYPYAVR